MFKVKTNELAHVDEKLDKIYDVTVSINREVDGVAKRFDEYLHDHLRGRI